MLYSYGDFYDELEDFAQEFSLEEVQAFEDDWTTDLYECDLEPIETFSSDWILERIDDERFSENNSDREAEKVRKILEENVDWEKINSLLPKLWFSTNRKLIVTKQDLLGIIKEL